jgi:hypothetical protein
MKPILNDIGRYLVLACLLSYAPAVWAQTPGPKNHILIDIAHGQRFWNDPITMSDADASFVERVKYMTDQIIQTAASVNGDVGYIKRKIKPADLAVCNLLFIHLPASKYDADEVDAIKKYLQKGGTLFLVMDVDYWSTLAQTNVNAIISLSDIKFGHDSADTLSGGYTKAGLITQKPLKVTYHGARRYAILF